MKKLPDNQNIHESVEPVRLYLDELEWIVAHVAEMRLSVRITADGYEYESLAELGEKRGHRVRQLEIEGRGPSGASGSASVHFERQSARLFVWNPEALGGGVYQLRDYLRRLRLRHAYYASHNFWFLLTLGLVWAPRFTDSAVEAAVASLGAVAALLIALAVLFRRAPFTGIFLRRRHEGGILWRNRDAILVQTVVALVTGLIGFALGRLTSGPR